MPIVNSIAATPSARGDNPDEIRIDDLDSPPHEASSVEPEGAGKEAHQSPTRTAEMNPDEIVLEDEIEDVVVPAPQQETKFLALDKCIPGRQFLEVISNIMEFKSCSISYGEPGHRYSDDHGCWREGTAYVRSGVAGHHKSIPSVSFDFPSAATASRRTTDQGHGAERNDMAERIRERV